MRVKTFHSFITSPKAKKKKILWLYCLQKAGMTLPSFVTNRVLFDSCDRILRCPPRSPAMQHIKCTIPRAMNMIDFILVALSGMKTISGNKMSPLKGPGQFLRSEIPGMGRNQPKGDSLLLALRMEETCGKEEGQPRGSECSPLLTANKETRTSI